MKRKSSKPLDEELLREYDFSDKNAVRGKHAKALKEGYTVTIHNEDGTTMVKNFNLPKNTVVLDPDVHAYFPDSESVNKALRTIIALVPKKNRSVSEKRSRYGK